MEIYKILQNPDYKGDISPDEYVEKYLNDNYFDGLCNDDCACILDDLMPCGFDLDNCICHPGIVTKCDCGDHDFHVTKCFRDAIEVETAELNTKIEYQQGVINKVQKDNVRMAEKVNNLINMLNEKRCEFNSLRLALSCGKCGEQFKSGYCDDCYEEIEEKIAE